jgi:hypothetical protein
MERAGARSARAQAASAIRATVRWTRIAPPVLRARNQAYAGRAGEPDSGDGSQAVQLLRGGTLKMDATNEEGR